MDIRSKIGAIYSLEQLSGGSTVIHRLHPLCKMIAALVFIVTVVSFDRRDFGRLVPFIFYPAVLIPLSETPYVLLLKRVWIVLPFCLFMGISNLLLEREPAFIVGNITFTYGIVSFGVILYRACLCVTAVLLLVAVTPFTELTSEMRRLKVPGLLVIMFEMTYRYIAVLFGEAASMQTAYTLRGGGVKGVDIRQSGSFIGNLLVRSFDRAERIYSAMQCRGYPARKEHRRKRGFRFQDAVYCVVTCGFCLFFRLTDAGRLLSVLVERIR